MVRTLVLLCSILVCGLPLWSQSETPPLELYGGYSHVGNYGIGLNGWLATATYNVDRWFGVEGDANGNYGTKNLGAAAALLTNVPNSIHSRMHNFNFGPRIAYRPSSTDRYDAFGHVLFGASHTNVSAFRGWAGRYGVLMDPWRRRGLQFQPFVGGAFSSRFSANPLL